MMIDQIMGLIGGGIYFYSLFLEGPVRKTIQGAGTGGAIVGGVVGFFTIGFGSGILWGLGVGAIFGVLAVALEIIGNSRRF